jgi:hypothetical protein
MRSAAGLRGFTWGGKNRVMTNHGQAYPCPHWCRARGNDVSHRWGGSPENYRRQHLQRFGQFLVVQTERLSPAGVRTTLDDAELVHPDPLDDSDTNLHRDIRESSVLLRHVRGLER